MSSIKSKTTSDCHQRRFTCCTYNGIAHVLTGTKDLANLAPGFQQYSVWLGEKCDLDPLQFQCPDDVRFEHLYIAVKGTFTVATRTGTYQAGRITGSLTNLHFLEWVKQPNGDHQTGTRCADLLSEDFDMSFP